MFKSWVPHGVRFWSLMIFILFFQFTGGIYAASISQIQGELAFISEDVTMASYCSLIGLNIIFPVLFRWKFFFYTRQMWFVASIGSLLCAVAAFYCNVPWLFCGICLFAGYFKLMGMFATVSNVQLNWTPTRSFGVFLPIIFLFVTGTVQLSNIAMTWIAYYFNWKLMYCVIVVMMLAIDAIAYFMMKPDHRCGPFVPLKGVDWIGHILWAAFCVAAAYVFNYGEHYEWWESREICLASYIAVVLLILAIVRMLRLGERAFITPSAFTYPITYFLLVLLMGVNIALGAAHYLQPIYVNGILGYDSINAIDLNWPQLAGIIMGAIFSFWAIIKLKWSLRRYFFCCLLFFFMYAATMYFIALPQTPKEYLTVPIFILGFADVMIEVGGTYALSQKVPWPVFFPNITIIGFVRCGIGTAAGASIVERLFASNMRQYGIVDAVRETFGVASWVMMAMLVLILASNFKSAPLRLVPKWTTVVGLLRREAAPQKA
ncbi:MAG: hypothetical protein NC102_04255 [Clostridium sp.]|nr:hypothetical protein [Clostridium sp.]